MLADERYWREVVAHLVDREDAADNHVGLGADEHGHDETGTVAQLQVRVKEERLKRKEVY